MEYVQRRLVDEERSKGIAWLGALAGLTAGLREAKEVLEE
jgi:hypothetical protein